MNNDRKIDYLELPASDLDAVQGFYAQVFGWTFQAYGPDYLAFSDGRLDGGFYRSQRQVSTANGSVLVVFHALDLEAVQADVMAAGGSIVTPPFDFPGGRRFHFADPCGNELAVWSAAPAPA